MSEPNYFFSHKYHIFLYPQIRHFLVLYRFLLMYIFWDFAILAKKIHFYLCFIWQVSFVKFVILALKTFNYPLLLITGLFFKLHLIRDYSPKD